MSDNKSQELNKDNSEMFKILADVSKQNSDAIIKQTESITALTSGQESMVKTLDTINETLKGVGSSDNNNPTGPGIGMDQTSGSKLKIPNVVAPDEHGVQGNEGPAKDKGGLSMEAKKEFELKLKAEEAEAKDKKDYEDYKEKKKTDEKEKTDIEEKKKADEDKEKEMEEKKKTDEDKEKENKYKSFNYDNNTTVRPSIMEKQFETVPDGYQIIKATMGGWDVDGIDAEGAYIETLKRLNNREFGSFGQETVGGGNY